MKTPDGVHDAVAIAPLRVCPAFKIFWVENGKIVSIKRHDHDKPYTLPAEIFIIVKRVYQSFNLDEHFVKFKDEDEDLIDLSATDNISFQFDADFTQFYIYVFTSKEDATNFILPSTCTGVPRSRGRHICTGRHEPQINGTELSAKNVAATNCTPVTETPDTITNSIESAYKLALTATIGSFHKNIYCDSCLDDIPSNRYKCLECPNFDLCLKCESKGLHPEHLMARMSQSFVRKHKSNLHDALDEIYAKAAKRRK